MSPTRTAAAPGDLLLQASDTRQTGALVVAGNPGGAVYLVEGRVMYAESPAAPGVGELLTSSGRLAGRTWQQALDIGGTTARVGRLLVEQGHLTQGELELCVLGSTYDAAYFVLSDRSAPAEFRAGATHWLGQVVHIDAAAVDHEVGRRIQLLDDIFPNPRIDVAPVIPVSRPPRERITVTAPQWELLVQADGQRTPADLAQLLGRAGYAIIQELRRMAAAGLIELPEERVPDTPEFVRLPHPRGGSAPLDRPTAGRSSAAPVSPPVVFVPDPTPAPAPIPELGVPEIHIPEPHLPEPRIPEPHIPEQNAGPNRPRLARRKPGAKLPREFADEGPQVHQGTDEVLLKRIRTALRALR
ncbi:DUF4388 domain-containing protein [Actinoplanes couchii]|uniref:PatA-like N-terminal domain-containing protein n=1 Tax=Actinoplanes couchii TaxID=403638 RepID=A0ABQ3XQB0_9ACTN|nr:DUF4388 domain-containing protein [Actinoplanes couchii]MDR6322990.1 hypothetical protein [Actinoplanes couchii]GID60664.1 hypothetical protein Aco03nite_090680 [Actinoplanes couchii]